MSDFKTYSSDEINQARTDERLLEEIIENFSPYIRKLSRKYSKINRLNDYDDLINVGYFSVYYAVNNYKSELGYAFSTYCMENIKLRILNSARNRSKKDKQDFKTKSLNVLVGAENGREDYLENLNPESLVILKDCKIDADLASAKVGDSFQFMRNGYFTVDKKSTDDKKIFNLTVTLKDSYKPTV